MKCFFLIYRATAFRWAGGADVFIFLKMLGSYLVREDDRKSKNKY